MKVVLFGAAAFLVCGFFVVGNVAHASTLNVVPDEGGFYSALVKGADHLVSQQNSDGGWAWTASGGSSANTFGVTGLGLLDAYEITHDSTYLTKAQLTADHLLGITTPTDLASDNTNKFYSQDIVFLVKAGQLIGNSAYTSKASALMTHFINEPNRYCNASSTGCITAQDIADAYHNMGSAYAAPSGLTEWQLSSWVEAAKLTGNNSWATDLANIVKSDVIDSAYSASLDLTGGKSYALGLAGALRATAIMGVSNSDVLTKLVAEQNADGSIKANTNDGIKQTTAYAVLGFAAANDQSDAVSSTAYLAGTQNSTSGGWTESDGTEYTEVNSEIIQAISSVLTSGNYYSIQDAVNAASDGDTINVAAGTYSETLQINKPLTLLGAKANVDARNTSTRGSGESVILSTSTDGSIQIGSAGPVAGTVTINGFTIGNSTTSPYKAIHVMQQTNDVVVENNIIEPSTYDGINLYSAVQGTIDQNLVLGATTSGITMGNSDVMPNIVTQATITNNKVENSEYGITGYMSSSTISGNEVIGSSAQTNGSGIGGEFYNTSITNNTVSGYSAGVGIGFKNQNPARANASGMTISGNTVYDNGYNFYAVSTSTGTTVSGNYLESPGGVNTLVLNSITTGYSFSGNYYSNWSGTGNYAITGTDDGTTVSTTSSAFADTSPMIRPVYVSTTGTDGPTYGTVTNPYRTIQYGIDNVTPGGTVNVAAGTYTENVSVNKSVAIVGSGLSTTSTLDGMMTITGNNVSVKNMTFTNPNGSTALLVSGASHVSIMSNKFDSVGTTLSAGSAQAIDINGGTSTAMSDITIDDNTISNVGSLNLAYSASVSGTSAKGIYIGDSTGVNIISGVVINNNTISHIQASTAAWNVGRGAYGILVNHANHPTDGSTGVTITNNTISDLEGLWAHAIGLEGNTPNAVVTGNTVEGLVSHKTPSDAVGVQVEDNANASTVKVNGNSFGDAVAWGVVNAVSTTTVDAANNYWGTVSSTTIASMTSGGVDYAPWSNGLGSETNVEADAPEVIIGSNATSSTSTVNVPEDATSTTLNASALLDTTNDSVTLPGAITVNATTSIGNVNVQIPAGIKITGTSGWTGIINVPQVKANNTVSVTPDVNHGASISSVIEIGSNSTPLTFDQAVRILMVGQGGKYVGYYRNGAFTPITAACSADTQSAGNSLSAGGDCKIDVNNGADLVVWTKHFTSFVTYTQYVTSVTTYATGGGGGGGGGGYVAPLPAATAPVTTVTQPATTPAAPAVGQVLGAQAFRFTEDLSEGMQSDNVTELQNRLTSEGVYSGPVTGYFGSLTLAGVKEYQAKHSLPTTGFVGPMTRAELNAALTSAASQGQVLGAQTTGTAETIARIQGIIQQLQAEGGQEKIISVLQMVLAFLGQ